ncbi:hypothetical protein [Rhizobium ruizarguesonis]|uniref:hypothetical protein n=1 Tax=Rhizobium ruizarguesonis TaxID=2081791 RepID=UPI001FDABB2C|nr:hypothetical protein [Rhizobium ruizarguesonis]
MKLAINKRLSSQTVPEQKMQSFRLLGIGLACAVLAACEEKAEVAPPPQQVRIVAAAGTPYQPGAEIAVARAALGVDAGRRCAEDARLQSGEVAPAVAGCSEGGL